jgi:quinate dehydrogenase (quinone)
MRGMVLVVGLLVILSGGALAYGGFELLQLGGSPYYLLTGVGLLVSGGLLVFRKAAGLWLYLLLFVITLVWSIAEVGLAYWPLFPRLFAPLVLLLLVLLIAPGLVTGPWRLGALNRNSARLAAGVAAIALTAFGASGFKQHGVISPDSSTNEPLSAAAGVSEWRYVGGNAGGTRYAAQDQINLDNVKDLEVAWTLRTGDLSGEGRAEESTPLQVGDTLYTCTPNNHILAIDAVTGKLRWKFDPKAKPGLPWRKCRGVSYYETPSATDPTQICRQRIIFNTIDARLMALDSSTGKPCPEFGDGGSVDLKQGMGEVRPGFYMQTSPPTVARGVVVIGGWVADNMAMDEPGGVIRAFNAETGDLVWAWDPGNPQVTKEPLENGHYTRSTPNSWSLMSVDGKLGMVYLPTGNPTSDFWGPKRRPGDDAHSSSVIALDIETGRLKWKFQTVHHDVWDYDVPAQPLLYDIPDDKGGTTPALVQLTKQGQIYLLNRETGKPIAKVEERPVLQDGVPGERLSPTQPFSVGMPSPSVATLSESSMWGLTPLDQLSCRIRFKKSRYDGMYTPPTLKPSIMYPGPAGGYNWGSGAIDEKRGYLIVGDIRLPFYQRLVSRAEFDKLNEGINSHFVGMSPVEGADYAADYGYLMSPIGVPCVQPPFGTITAIDLKTHKIVWQRPAGTTRDIGPLGIRTNIPMPIGLGMVSGPLITSSGLIFHSGTQDRYIRAYDTRNGAEVWKGRLPVGSVAAPMTYRARNGRQFIIVNAGGSLPVSALNPMPKGDYIIAYALPEEE